MLGCVGDVGILCFAPIGHLAQSQCWDMLGCVGDIGIFRFDLIGHLVQSQCWDMLGMLGYNVFSFWGLSAIPMLGYVGMCWECWDIRAPKGL